MKQQKDGLKQQQQRQEFPHEHWVVSQKGDNAQLSVGQGQEHQGVLPQKQEKESLGTGGQESEKSQEMIPMNAELKGHNG